MFVLILMRYCLDHETLKVCDVYLLQFGTFIHRFKSLLNSSIYAINIRIFCLLGPI